MTEKQKPRTNPRAGSSDRELWDPDLDWYFNEFESLCGLQSIGTSGAGENQLSKPTDEEKASKKERLRNGFLLTMPEKVKADLRSVSPGDADRAAFAAMAHGIFKRGRRIWRRLTALPYVVQQLLKQSYEERLPEAGVDWGSGLLDVDAVRLAHRMYLGSEEAGRIIPREPTEQPRPPVRKWQNPTPCGQRHTWVEVHHE